MRRALVVAVVIVALAGNASAASRRGVCGAASRHGTSRIAVLSAFPAELAPLVAAAQIETTVQADGRSYYLARLEGVRVVLGLTGIGMVNAGDRTASVIRNFAPEAILFNGVAGSRYNIADVVVVAEWVEATGGDPVPVNPALLALTHDAVAKMPPTFENCADIPPPMPTQTVCLPYTPMVVFGQRGQTSDPFGGNAFACIPGAGDVFGCDVPLAPAAAVRLPMPEQIPTEEVEDMETAVVAGLAASADVPFVAMRAVSDGAGDPLGDRGFPAQFFDYYRLAAGNAALVTRAVLADVARFARHRRAVCRLLARRRWDQAATRIGGGS